MKTIIFPLILFSPIANADETWQRRVDVKYKIVHVKNIPFDIDYFIDTVAGLCFMVRDEQDTLLVPCENLARYPALKPYLENALPAK